MKLFPGRDTSSHLKISLACAPQLPGGAARLILEIADLIEAEDGTGLRALLERATGLSAHNGDAEHDRGIELVAPVERLSNAVPGSHRHVHEREAAQLAETG